MSIPGICFAIAASGVVLGLGCAGDNADDASATDPQVWHLASTPVMTIGEEGQPLDHLFDQISFLEIMPGGGIAVFDYGSTTVRVFDRAGHRISTLGGIGQGPGEFTNVAGVWYTPPDTIKSLDWAQRRITTFLLDGTVVNTQPLSIDPVEPKRGHLVGGLKDGGFVTFESRAVENAEDTPLRRASVSYYRFDREGRYVGQIAGGPGTWRYTPAGSTDGIPPSFQGIGLTYQLSPKPSAALSKDALLVLDDVRPEVAVITAGAEIMPIIHLPDESVPAGDAVVQATAAMQESGISEATIDRFRHSSTSDAIPQYARILVDDQDRIWVRRFDPSKDALVFRLRIFGDFHGGEWLVVNKAGDIVATIVLPDRFILMDVNEELVAGIGVDQLGIETVIVYRIEDS